MYIQQQQLFLHWINKQIQYYTSINQSTTSINLSNTTLNELNNNIKSTQRQYNLQNIYELIDNGLIDKLLLQIDKQYFYQQLMNMNIVQQQGETNKYEYKSKQYAVKQYWDCLNKYLISKFNKQINPQYLNKQINFQYLNKQTNIQYLINKTNIKKQLTTRNYYNINNQISVNTNNGSKSNKVSVNTNNDNKQNKVLTVNNKLSINESIIQILKLIFYLLVQKYNNCHNNNNQSNQQSNNNKQHEYNNQTNNNTNVQNNNSHDNSRYDNSITKQIRRSMNQTLQSSTLLINSNLLIHQSSNSININNNNTYNQYINNNDINHDNNINQSQNNILQNSNTSLSQSLLTINHNQSQFLNQQTIINQSQQINQSQYINQSQQINYHQSSIINQQYLQQQTNLQQQQTNSLFLQRICSLPQQVQSYLVSIVQSIQSNLIIQSISSQPYYQQITINQIKQNQFNPSSISSLNTSINYLITSTLIQSSQLSPNQQLSSQLSPNQQLSPHQQDNNNFKKIIYKQIQQVNQQNQQIKQKIQQLIDQNYKLQKQIQENLIQQNNLINKINHYTQQKQQLFQYLKQQHTININSLQQFIEICKHIEQENQLLQNTIAQIQQKNYQLQTNNAQKVHSINKNALEITKTNQQINKYKSKIKGLKQDIQYLDQFVNNGPLLQNQPIINYSNCNQFNAELVTSFDVQDQNQMIFNKSIDIQARHSFGNVLRENKDIYNQKILKSNKNNNTHNRILTDSLTGYGSNRLSLPSNQKQSTHKKTHKSNFPQQQNRQNIEPTPFQQDQLKIQNFESFPSKSNSHLSIHYQQQEQKQIQEQKQKYRQQLVNSLESLYKQIADLTKEVAQVKQQNKEIQKRNYKHQKKINQLKSLHQAFIKEAYKP